jgi:hypothetical protein
MKKLSVMLMVGAMWLTATVVRADVKSCLKTAGSTYKGCKTGCQNAFLDDRANCKGVAPGCLSACIDARTTCLDAADASLNTCLATCDPIVANGKATCKTSCGCGGSSNPCAFDTCYVHCLDPYEQIAFSCRDNCRNQFQLGGGPAAEAACRTQFKSCVGACPAQ